MEKEIDVYNSCIARANVSLNDPNISEEMMELNMSIIRTSHKCIELTTLQNGQIRRL